MSEIRPQKDAILIFMQEFNDKKKQEKLNTSSNTIREDRKKKKLEPIKAFLDQLQQSKLKVANNKYTSIAPVKSDNNNEDMIFLYKEIKSSPSWSPGISLFFEHPIETEIAIPNDYDIEEFGEVVIKTSGYHKDNHIINRKFYSIEEAKKALALFLGKNARGLEDGKQEKEQKFSTYSKKAMANFLENNANKEPNK